MDGRALLELAKAIARVVHDGQYRKGTGEPYFNHVERVAGRVYGWKAKTVAYLHDVVEDTGITLEMLAILGFPQGIIDAVAALSRNEEESYVHFIQRAIDSKDPVVFVVKMADLQDNLDDVDELAPQDARQLRHKYTEAERMLIASEL